MTALLLLLAALFLVAFAGLMAALDAALSVTSRADLAEWALTARARRSLRAISSDNDAHLNAVVFIRILAETAAAVFVTVALTILLDSIWWAMLAAVILMTGASFVLVGASPRTVGRQLRERATTRAQGPRLPAPARAVRVGRVPVRRRHLVVRARGLPARAA